MNSLQSFAPILSPCQEKNNACAAYRSCTVVYMCNRMGIGGLRRAIFGLISAVFSEK